MRPVEREALDCDDPVGCFDVSDADGAGALHFVVDVHGAGAALGDAAAIFRAGEADLLADDPQERRVGLCLHVTYTSIDIELCHEHPLANVFYFLVAWRRAGRRMKRIEGACEALSSIAPRCPPAYGHAGAADARHAAAESKHKQVMRIERSEIRAARSRRQAITFQRLQLWSRPAILTLGRERHQRGEHGPAA